MKHATPAQRLFVFLIGLAAIGALVLAECQRIAAEAGEPMPPPAHSVPSSPADGRDSCPNWDVVG